MKKILMSGAVLMLLAAPAMAEDKMPPGDGAPPQHQGMFERADANNDGKVSKAEYNAQQEKFFAETDKDGNGELTKDEMKARREAMREKFKAWRDAHPRKEGAPGMKHDEKPE